MGLEQSQDIVMDCTVLLVEGLKHIATMQGSGVPVRGSTFGYLSSVLQPQQAIWFCAPAARNRPGMSAWH